MSKSVILIVVGGAGGHRDVVGVQIEIAEDVRAAKHELHNLLKEGCIWVPVTFGVKVPVTFGVKVPVTFDLKVTGTRTGTRKF